MSTGGWLILLVFAVAIVVIVNKFLHSDSEEFSPAPTPKPPKPEPKPILVQEKKLDYVTIYEFNPVKNIKVCRFCDGENPIDSHQCGICGEEIDA